MCEGPDAPSAFGGNRHAGLTRTRSHDMPALPFRILCALLSTGYKTSFANKYDCITKIAQQSTHSAHDMNKYLRSKAAPNTLCQKCLQKGHFSYECQTATQSRPYTSRPSRTQQLVDPKLRPQITNTALEKEIKSVALDTIERQRQRSHSEDITKVYSRKRSRSSSRSSSVSTISTRSSRTHSPQRPNYDGQEKELRTSTQRSGQSDSLGIKRRRRTSSVSCDDKGDMTLREDTRITRARKRSMSPQERGRGTERSRRDGQRSTRVDEARDSHMTRYAEKLIGASEDDRPRRRDGPTTTMARRTTEYDMELRNNSGQSQYNESGRVHRDQERSPSPYSQRVALSTKQKEK